MAVFLMVSCGGSDSSSDEKCTYGTYRCEGSTSYYCNNGWNPAENCTNGCDFVTGMCNQQQQQAEENGCKKLYDCYNQCYNNAMSSTYCFEDCRKEAVNSDLSVFDKLRECQQNWESARSNGSTDKTEKDYCATEYKNCGM